MDFDFLFGKDILQRFHTDGTKSGDIFKPRFSPLTQLEVLLMSVFSEILSECKDAYDRASRLSDCCEPLITNTSIPNSMVRHEDLAIYTRWLVHYFHSIKNIQNFL